jgi:hypothetical protein
MKGFRRLGWLALALSLAAVTLAGGLGCSTEVKTKVNFLRDWEAAKEQAASDNKPIMINFYTSS